MPIVLANEDGSYVEPVKTSRVSLVVLSDELRPQQITAALGLQPDEWALRGELESHPPGRWKRSRPHPHHTWKLASRLPESAEPEAHLADVLDRLGSAADRVADLKSDLRIHSVRLWLFLQIDNENPGIGLDATLLSRLAELGTGLDIDVYVDLADAGQSDATATDTVATE